MPLILAIESDRKLAASVATLAGSLLRAEILVAESTERAFALLGTRTPDLILTSMLLSPRDETALADRLKDLDAAGTHVQTLVIPVLASSSRKQPKPGGLLGRLRLSKQKTATSHGCEPDVFAAQITEYLERAAAERASATAAYEDAVASKPLSLVERPAAEGALPQTIVPTITHTSFARAVEDEANTLESLDEDLRSGQWLDAAKVAEALAPAAAPAQPAIDLFARLGTTPPEPPAPIPTSSWADPWGEHARGTVPLTFTPDEASVSTAPVAPEDTPLESPASIVGEPLTSNADTAIVPELTVLSEDELAEEPFAAAPTRATRWFVEQVDEDPVTAELPALVTSPAALDLRAQDDGWEVIALDDEEVLETMAIVNQTNTLGTPIERIASFTTPMETVASIDPADASGAPGTPPVLLPVEPIDLNAFVQESDSDPAPRHSLWQDLKSRWMSAVSQERQVTWPVPAAPALPRSVQPKTPVTPAPIVDPVGVDEPLPPVFSPAVAAEPEMASVVAEATAAEPETAPRAEAFDSDPLADVPPVFASGFIADVSTPVAAARVEPIAIRQEEEMPADDVLAASVSDDLAAPLPDDVLADFEAALEPEASEWEEGRASEVRAAELELDRIQAVAPDEIAETVVAPEDAPAVIAEEALSAAATTPIATDVLAGVEAVTLGAAPAANASAQEAAAVVASAAEVPPAPAPAPSSEAAAPAAAPSPEIIDLLTSLKRDILELRSERHEHLVEPTHSAPVPVAVTAPVIDPTPIAVPAPSAPPLAAHAGASLVPPAAPMSWTPVVPTSTIVQPRFDTPPLAAMSPARREEAAVTAEAPAVRPTRIVIRKADRLKKRKKARKEQRPAAVQDEWGFFDPEKCGFAALLAKLDEITDR